MFIQVFNVWEYFLYQISNSKNSAAQSEKIPSWIQNIDKKHFVTWLNYAFILLLRFLKRFIYNFLLTLKCTVCTFTYNLFETKTVYVLYHKVLGDRRLSNEARLMWRPFTSIYFNFFAICKKEICRYLIRKL